MIGRRGQIGFFIRFLAIVIVLVAIYALMGDAWGQLFSSATTAAGMTGAEAWFYEHYTAIIIGMATLLLFIAGSVALSGGDD